MMNSLENKNILLVISGGIAAYKSLELIRLIRKAGGRLKCILTKGGEQFVTPLSVSALCEEKVYTDQWSLDDESKMGHIRLTREADIIIIAPASADILAKMANGLANDLASTALLASNTQTLIAPAMNHAMWDNLATQENIEKLKLRGFKFIGPYPGEMACGEHGLGRMAEPEEIFQNLQSCFLDNLELSGLKALVTSGPTYEPLDPVRFIGNKSSGKQGHAIAKALSQLGAQVTLISGPVSIPDPDGIKTIHVQTAVEMLDACRHALPVDIAVCAAAVSDWSASAVMKQKIKKHGDRTPPDIKLKENPDILATLAGTPKKRPKLVIGFAAETENLLDNAKIKKKSKGCDWIVANNVSDDKKVFGGENNEITLLTETSSEEWPKMSKAMIANELANRIALYFSEQNDTQTEMAAE